MKDLESILKKLTLEEKVSLLAGADLWTTVPILRLGVPSLKMTDGPNGARGAGGFTGPPSACFPVGVALAATWNPELVWEIGAALAEETLAKGAQLLLAPTVNLHRSPLAGRNFECYSEDPWLTARMAVNYIQGLQSAGVGACIKHFVCNDSEFQRNSISSVVPERALRELYLYPFMVALQEAQPWAVMSAYNKINGAWASENSRLLEEILKGEWGFDGVVISDWYGTYTDEVFSNGLDLEMPGPARHMGEQLVRPLRKGQLGRQKLDDKVRRILKLMDKAGLFDQPANHAETAYDSPEHRRLIRKAAGEAVVLLKNQNGLLPLGNRAGRSPHPAGGIRSLAVIGHHAQSPVIMGGGSSSVNPHPISTPLEAIQTRAGGQIEVRYAPGVLLYKDLPLLNPAWLTCGDGSYNGWQLLLYNNAEFSGQPADLRYINRTEISWQGELLSRLKTPDNFSARLDAFLQVPEAGHYQFELKSSGRCRLWVGDRLVVDRFSGQAAPAPAMQQIENRGEMDLQPGVAYGLRLEYIHETQSPWEGLRLGCLLPQPLDMQSEAVQLAGACDAAVVFVGLTPEWESEGFDRLDLDLPLAQAELIEQVAQVNPNTIVVISAGSPVSMPWLEHVSSVLYSWYLGQEVGNAIADLLFGEVNPSGKLPTSFPKRLKDTPAYLHYPGENGEVFYGEGIYIGYRYYDIKDVEPLFPFGFGLSYTTFKYLAAFLDKPRYTTNETIQLTVTVENTGPVLGHEIVQVYVHPVKSVVGRPPRELKAFKKLPIEPGQSQTICLELNPKTFAFYDVLHGEWVVEPGLYLLEVASSSRDIHFTLEFTLEAAGQSYTDHSRLGINTPLRFLFENPASRAILEKHAGSYIKHPQLHLVMDMNLVQLSHYAPFILTRRFLEKIDKELAEIHLS